MTTRDIGLELVTLGGGHGQAALLKATRLVDVRVAAVVSVADDGGHSGLLRDAYGVPPLGDLRRCMSALARDRALAARMEEPLREVRPGIRLRVGNLVLMEKLRRTGDLIETVRWACELLQCDGEVVPAAVTPGQLAIYDPHEGVLRGEALIDYRGSRPMAVTVNGPDGTCAAAREALARADRLVVSPGSFVTSTLAVMTHPGIGKAFTDAPGEKLMFFNLAPERGWPDGPDLGDHLRLLRDHVLLRGGADRFDLTVVRHGEGGEERIDDQTRVITMPLARADAPAEHDPELVASALASVCGVSRRSLRSTAGDREDARRTFETYLEAALTHDG